MLESIKKEPYEATEIVANWLSNRKKCAAIKELVIVRTNYMDVINYRTRFYCKWVRKENDKWTRTICVIKKQTYEQLELNDTAYWNIIYNSIRWSHGETLYISIKY